MGVERDGHGQRWESIQERMAGWYRGDCRFRRREDVSYGTPEMGQAGEVEEIADDDRRARGVHIFSTIGVVM